jgi:hypothetical protein
LPDCPDIKVQQELLRHANIQTTMNIYTQAVSEQKRAANSKVVEMVLRQKAEVKPASQENERLNGRMGSRFSICNIEAAGFK